MSDSVKTSNDGRCSNDSVRYQQAEDIVIVAALLVHSGRTFTAKGIVAALQRRCPAHIRSEQRVSEALRVLRERGLVEQTPDGFAARHFAGRTAPRCGEGVDGESPPQVSRDPLHQEKMDG
jgi:hypothetical protein